MLSIENVHHSYRVGFWLKRSDVLSDISFQVPEKSIFGFLGANGAGKTTLIQLMVGLRPPTRGKIQLRGHDCTSIEARSRVGYLPERPYFQEHLTGRQLLEYFGTLAGLPRLRVRDRIPVVLKAVGMEHARDRELKKYSKGMLQRIGIAQAILHEPEFLVLDEPMSGLDPVGRKEMRELIAQLASAGQTVFFSSHVIPDVEAICDRVAVIKQGKLLGCGPIHEFLAQEKHAVEIGFSGISEKAAKELSILSHFHLYADGYRAQVSSEYQINFALEKLIAAGATIQWVQPVRPSLEDLFYA